MESLIPGLRVNAGGRALTHAGRNGNQGLKECLTNGTGEVMDKLFSPWRGLSPGTGLILHNPFFTLSWIREGVFCQGKTYSLKVIGV